MAKWRVWHSAKSFCEFIVDKTILSTMKDEIEFKPLPESDASKGGTFHKVPDHIKKILYLDAADVIIEYNSEPIVCIEETKEAGTGHNAMQRFARIAAAAENNVPVLYLMPEAKIISRRSAKGTNVKWDSINPAIFLAFDSVMEIFKIPTLFFYYPSDYRSHPDPLTSPNYSDKGIRYTRDSTHYPACPDDSDSEIQKMLEVIDIIIQNAIDGHPTAKLIDKRAIRDRKRWQITEYSNKLNGRTKEELSPITATVTIPTQKLLNHLATYSDAGSDNISELLSSRSNTVIYQCDATFREDPYAGSLAAIDYLLCREGKTYEDRDANLVLCFGRVNVDDDKITVASTKCSVNDFIGTVRKSGKNNLLTTDRFSKIKPKDIGRYYMQVRYGSTYSKAKHIRVFSYFADAILFKDGALWREA